MEIDINKIISASEILADTRKISDKLSEHSELIVFDDNKPQFVILSLTKYKELNGAPSSCEKSENTKVKIGKLVQDSIIKLIDKDMIPFEEIELLCTLEYSNSTFGLNFPMLKEFDTDPEISIDMQKKDKNGYNRYYKYLLNIYGKQYLLCSQWNEGLHRKKYLSWLEKIKSKNGESQT